jgi:hypothetical protein
MENISTERQQVIKTSNQQLSLKYTNTNAETHTKEKGKARQCFLQNPTTP